MGPTWGVRFVGVRFRAPGLGGRKTLTCRICMGSCARCMDETGSNRSKFEPLTKGLVTVGPDRRIRVPYEDRVPVEARMRSMLPSSPSEEGEGGLREAEGWGVHGRASRGFRSPVLGPPCSPRSVSPSDARRGSRDSQRVAWGPEHWGRECGRPAPVRPSHKREGDGPAFGSPGA